MGFKTIAKDKDMHEVCRMFLASLQLVSNVFSSACVYLKFAYLMFD